MKAEVLVKSTRARLNVKSMSKSFFQFKEFGVHQDKCAMKISTDGVILGAYSGSGNPVNILDIGIGTGVVSLMLAQRFPKAQITGVEIDEEAFLQASTNAGNSPWADRITFLNQSFQDFYLSENPKFDLIVSNPPFYQNHLKSKDQKRNMALHNDSLPFSILMEGTAGLLNEGGSFWVILPLDQMKILEGEAFKLGLSSRYSLIIKDNPQKKPHREIRSFSFNNTSLNPNELIIKDIHNSYSSAYAALLKDFLLIF